MTHHDFVIEPLSIIVVLFFESFIVILVNHGALAPNPRTTKCPATSEANMSELSYTHGPTGLGNSLQVESLPAKSVAYLLQYGYAQSMQDAIAGDAKRIREKLVTEAAEAGNPAPTADEIEAAIKSGIGEALGERHKAILDGTVGDRVGAVRDPFGTMCKTIALQMLREALKAANAKMPDVKTETGKAKLAEMVEAVISRNKDAVEKEAKRRLAPVKGVTVDLTGIV